MCAISGFYNVAIDRGVVFSSMHHRGPDEQNHYIDGGLTFLHARLAIQDISGGKQPMQIDNLVIVFNGEIYNHLELRSRYLSTTKFTSHSDTETLLRLYEKYGKDSLQMLDGMFAFCIYDKEKKTLFFARDRAGKKPLFLYRKDGKLAFASELVTLASSLKLDIDEPMIEAYLRCGFLPHNGAPYLDIASVAAGSWLEYDLALGSSKTGYFFDIADLYAQPKRDISKRDAIAEFKELFTKSVKDRLLSSDLEVGAFLSGGIDSGLTVAVASAFTDRLKTFTVSFDGSFDESALARKVSEKYGTEHSQISISMDIKNDVEKILGQYGHPFFDSSAIPSWYVSREAKKHVTVVLNGDGADELFGGYRRYVPIANNFLGFAKLLTPLLYLLPKPHNKMSAYNYLFRLLSICQKRGLDFYLSSTTDIFEDFFGFNPQNKYLQTMNTEVGGVFGNQQMTQLSQFLCIDFKEQLFSDLLVKMDIATMAHALEGRSPFLSKYMLDFAPTLPDSLKIDFLTTKAMLREVAKEYLPKELIYQPKRGFEVPLKKWVENDLREMIFDYLGADSYSSQFVPKAKIQELLHGRIDISAEKRAKMLWSMFALEVWHKGLKA